jgi:hypothetical protein
MIFYRQQWKQYPSALPIFTQTPIAAVSPSAHLKAIRRGSSIQAEQHTLDDVSDVSMLIEGDFVDQA